MKYARLLALLLVGISAVPAFAAVQEPEESKAKFDTFWKEVLPVGTQVKISEDYRPGGNATGKIAEYTGDNGQFWALLDILQLHRNLPEGYVGWDPETQPFPQEKVGILIASPVFRLSDGSTIASGLECSFKILDKELDGRVMKEFEEVGSQISRRIDEAYAAWEKEHGARLIHEERLVKGEIIVKFTRDAGPMQFSVEDGVVQVGIPSIDARNRMYGVYAAEKVYPELSPSEDAEKKAQWEALGLDRIFILKFPKDVDPAHAAADYARDSHIEYAEPNYTATTQSEEDKK